MASLITSVSVWQHVNRLSSSARGVHLVGCKDVTRSTYTITRELLSLFVGCLTSQKHASVSRDGSAQTCCHSEIEFADQTCYLIQLQYTDIGPTSLIADPMTPGAWQGSHRRSANFQVTGMTRKNPQGDSSNRAPDLLLSRQTL